MEHLENKSDKESNNHSKNQKTSNDENSSPSMEDNEMVDEEDISKENFLPLEILFRDRHYIAIIKPFGLLVHRTAIAEHHKNFVLQILRNQIRGWIYPIHRLDGPTTGVLVFGLHKKAASKLNDLFRKRSLKKTYYALVRGHAPDKGIIDHPVLKHGNKYPQNAITEYQTVAKGILSIAQFGYEQLYYSLVRVTPHTGRMHQIRKHLKHINFPIICDKKYGDWRHNKLFYREFGINNLFLLAKKLQFIHPYTDETIVIEAPFSDDLIQIGQHFGWDMAELEQREKMGFYELEAEKEADEEEKTEGEEDES